MEVRMTVYFIRQKGTNLVKIGRTLSDPIKRMAALQTANPHDLELLAISDDAPEAYYHGLFRSKSVRGEWYRLEDNDIVSIPNGLMLFHPLWASRVFWEMGEVVQGRYPDYYLSDSETK